MLTKYAPLHSGFLEKEPKNPEGNRKHHKKIHKNHKIFTVELRGLIVKYT
nr:hypothetical protein [uncultured Acetatifactor sp.]